MEVIAERKLECERAQPRPQPLSRAHANDHAMRLIGHVVCATQPSGGTYLDYYPGSPADRMKEGECSIRKNR